MTNNQYWIVHIASLSNKATSVDCDFVHLASDLLPEGNATLHD